MIRHLRVEGWRAFEHLSLELTEGVTFIVAENGIGKTSLIDAARWALYGARSGVDAGASRRFGDADMLVGVDLELPDTRVLRIDRVLADKTATVNATLEGKTLAEEDLPALFARQFGATMDFLSRTTVLPADAVTDSAGGVFELHKHLCHVYGVDDLLSTVDALNRVQRAAEAEAKSFRAQTRRTGEDLDRLQVDLAEVKTRLAEAESAREASRAALGTTFDQLRQAQRARDERLARCAQQKAVHQLWADSADLITTLAAADHLDTMPRPDADEISAASMLAWLRSAENAAVGEADTLRSRLAVVTGQREVADTAIATLHAAGAECPVCRRELDSADVTAAERAHEVSTHALREQTEQLSSELASAVSLIGRVRTLAGRASALSRPPLATLSAVDLDENTDTDPGVDVAARGVDAATARDDEVSQRLAEARAERLQLERRIDTEQQSLTQEHLSLQAHRREAASSLAAAVMTETADTILAGRIEPLATEIMHRWKQVFVDRGELQLRQDGQLVLVRDTHKIAFSHLSAGEKVIGLLATRLLVLAASTKASFLWLDEPLEHLDPANRRLAASLMTGAGGNLRQLVVTTYEANLARRLAEDPDVNLRYIRTGN